MSIESIGKGYNASQLAKKLDIPKSTVYNNPHAFGGIRIGGRWWFFEELVAEALRSQRKGGQADASMEKRQEGQTSTLWQGESKWDTESKKVRNMGGSKKVGDSRKRQDAAVESVDPHGLLNSP